MVYLQSTDQPGAGRHEELTANWQQISGTVEESAVKAPAISSAYSGGQSLDFLTHQYRKNHPQGGLPTTMHKNCAGRPGQLFILL